MNAWAADKNEIEITDLILQLKQKLSELKDKHQSKLYYNINNQMDLLIGKIEIYLFLSAMATLLKF